MNPVKPERSDSPLKLTVRKMRATTADSAVATIQLIRINRKPKIFGIPDRNSARAAPVDVRTAAPVRDRHRGCWHGLVFDSMKRAMVVGTVWLK